MKQKKTIFKHKFLITHSPEGQFKTQVDPLRNFPESHDVHFVAAVKHPRQFGSQFLQVKSLVSPNWPIGHVSKQLEALKKVGGVHFIHLVAPPEHHKQGCVQDLHSLSSLLG